MESKICNVCDEMLPLDDFVRSAKYGSGYMPVCTRCDNIRVKEAKQKYRKSKKGVIVEMYNSQVRNSKKRGHNSPTYTKQEFYDWMMASQEFHHRFNLWEVSNHDTMLKPSVDRLDDYKGYSFSNIQVLNRYENISKGAIDMKNGINNKQNQKVRKLTLEGVVICEYYSINEAERDTGVANQDIGKVCKGKRNKAGGFIWEYVVE